MFNLFENPLLLLVGAFAAHLGMGIICIFKGKSRTWRHYIPVAVLIVTAFALDFFIATDKEKINTIIAGCKNAVLIQNAAKLSSYIHPDYHDSMHPSKPSLENFYNSLLRQPLAEKINIVHKDIKIEKTEANVALSVWATIDPNSSYYEYLRNASGRFSLDLAKSPQGIWQIVRMEVLSINSRSMSWRDVK